MAETDLADVAAMYEALVAGLAPLGPAYLSVLHRDPESELVRGLAEASAARSCSTPASAR